MRINNLLRYKKLSKATSVLVLCAAIGLTAVLTACKEEVTAPVASDTSTTETTTSDVTTSETDGTTSVSESEGTTSASETEGTSTDVSVIEKTVEFTDDGDLSDDEELASIIESMEDEGYSFTGITGNITEDDSGSKKFIIVESDGKLYTVTADEDGTTTVSSDDLLLSFEDKIAGADTIDVNEYVTSESNVVVYSVDVTGDIDEDTIINVMEEEFPVLVVQG